MILRAWRSELARLAVSAAMRAALACVRAHALVVAAAAVLTLGTLTTLGLLAALRPMLARLRSLLSVPAATALIHAITGRSTCTLPSRSMRCEKHERRNWWQAGPGASTR